MRTRLSVTALASLAFAASPAWCERLWVPPTHAEVPQLNVVWPTTQFALARFSFRLPDDMRSFDRAVVVFLPEANHSGTVDAYIEIKGEGDTVSVFDVTPLLGIPVSFTEDELAEVDVSPLFETALQAASPDQLDIGLLVWVPTNIHVPRVLGLSFEYQSGPAPACYDDVNRYVDCGNGTVTDTVTGLVWLKDASCAALGNEPPPLGARWTEAHDAVAQLGHGGCGLTDGSSPGDWRLPTIAEWSASLQRAKDLGCGTVSSGVPPLTDISGLSCFHLGAQPFDGVLIWFYWSSTGLETLPSQAKALNFDGGGPFDSPKLATFSVWPVRK